MSKKHHKPTDPEAPESFDAQPAATDEAPANEPVVPEPSPAVAEEAATKDESPPADSELKSLREENRLMKARLEAPPLPPPVTMLEHMVRSGLCVLTRLYKGKIQQILVPDHERRCPGMLSFVAATTKDATQGLADLFVQRSPRHEFATLYEEVYGRADDGAASG